MAKRTKTIRVSEEELALLQQVRERQANSVAGKEEPLVAEKPTATTVALDAQKALADAFVDAINRTKPVEKKSVHTRKEDTPWTPKDGSPKAKLKRRMFQHGILIDGKVSNEEIELLNKVKPGRYCDGYVQVQLRKDRGLNIDYPVKTNSQRLKLINQYGITSLTVLLKRIIDEQENPVKYRRPEELDLYE